MATVKYYGYFYLLKLFWKLLSWFISFTAQLVQKKFGSTCPFSIGSHISTPHYDNILYFGFVRISLFETDIRAERKYTVKAQAVRKISSLVRIEIVCNIGCKQ